MNDDFLYAGALGTLEPRLGCAGSLRLAPSRPNRRPEPTPDDDPRVVKALEEYLAACERGERPNRRAFLEAHDAIAPVLAQCLSSLACLQAAVSHFDVAELDDTGPYLPTGLLLQPPCRLGDYQLLRELGRGGMGVVYEAEQVSLGRRVALKLLSMNAAMDPRQVQRFHVEVQVAAQLHHPHIVPIYAVGLESGIHYYAMQLIDGRSLAAVITALRESRSGKAGPRSCSGKLRSTIFHQLESGHAGQSQTTDSFCLYVARLGMQAALALEHAHRVGIVHRDIKPANLLVDDHDQLWVADFGLARLQGDSSLTVTGDLLGTVRYMSPEQALARRGIVDHRTDIYSLGVTLYELVTLRPAFEANDIQSLVHQITSEDPSPPTRFDSLIPRDLETVILKCMAKEPVNRYATALELADDLNRFLDDKPIRARRPALLERVVKWARRRRAVVLSAAIVMALSFICLSISTVLIWQAMARTEKESRAKEVELRRARGNLDLAHQALDLYLNAAESWFPRDPGAEARDGALLKTALAFYEQIASQNSADPYVQTRTFSAYDRVGDIRAALGEDWGADDAYRKALGVMVDLLNREPENDVHRVGMATVLQKFGNLFRKKSIYLPAEWTVSESVRLFRRVLDHNPSDPGHRINLAHALNLRASLKGDTGRIDEALIDSRAALDIVLSVPAEAAAGRPNRIALKKELASIHSNMGKWLQLGGKLAEAEAFYRKGMAFLDQVEVEAPGMPDTRESLALGHAVLGELLRATNRNQGSEALFKQAIGRLERLTLDYPRIPRYRKHLARVYVVLSTLYWSMDRFPESTEARRKAALFNPRLLVDERIHLNNLAWYLVTVPDLANRNESKGLALANQAVRLCPQIWASWNTLGVARYRNRDWAGAKEALETALSKKECRFAFDGFFLAMTLWQTGEQDPARQLFLKSEEWRLRHEPDDVELLRFRAEAEQLIGTGWQRRRADPPEMPTSVAEALRDPSFALPRPCPAPGSEGSEQAGICSDRTAAPPCPRERLADGVEQALLLIDMI